MTAADPPTLPPVGSLLAGKYRLIRILGAGGMGAVFEGHHVKLNQRVAVKFLRPEAASDFTLRERFNREARALAQIRSSNVCAVYDVDETPQGVPYIVMEFLEGRDMGQLLRERPETPRTARIDWIIQAAEGLSAAHTLGIVHRDIKPGNLMVVTQGATDTVKVVDFGIARLVNNDTTELTQNSALGTPKYMSPEQLAGEKVDWSSDLWSLSVTLYQVLSGAMPFEGPDTAGLVSAVLTKDPVSILTRVPDLPPRLWDAIAWALRKSSVERPRSVKEWTDALRPFSSTPTPSGVDVPKASAPNKLPKRALAGVAALFLAAFAITLVVLRSPPPASEPRPPETVVAPKPPPDPVAIAPTPPAVVPAPTIAAPVADPALPLTAAVDLNLNPSPPPALSPPPSAKRPAADKKPGKQRVAAPAKPAVEPEPANPPNHL